MFTSDYALYHRGNLAKAKTQPGSDNDSGLAAYSETFYPEEQTAATHGKFSNAKNKKSLRIDNKHKIIFNLDSDKVELYNLEKDPNEQLNLMN